MPAPQFVTTATLLGALLLASTPALGETFRLKLSDFQTQTAHGEDFLGVDFDFGHGFREISSVRLEIMLPAGIGSTILTSDHSSTQSELMAVVHDVSEEVDFTSVFPASSFVIAPLPPPPPIVRGRLPEIYAARPSVSNPGSQAGELSSIELHRGIVAIYNPFEAPDFLEAGHGSLSLQHRFTEFQEIANIAEGPAPLLDVLPPPWGSLMFERNLLEQGVNGIAGEIDSAWIVIEGAVVPEPSTAALAAGALLLTVGWFRRRG